MRKFAATFVLLSGLATIPTDASAAYCRASSVYGTWGWGRSYSVHRARAIALSQCAARTRRGYTCYIRYCV
jgi:hypothetical protein